MIPENPPLRILCVDDEPAIRSVLSAHLRRLGHQVEVACDGVEGWAIATRDLQAFDLIITDFGMPRMNGLTFAQQLREANYQGRLVVFSSSLAPHDKENFQQIGVDAIVEKGRPVQDLMDEVYAGRSPVEEFRNEPQH
jgi:two-component system, NarL family, sensor histidine kinase EvgS